MMTARVIGSRLGLGQGKFEKGNLMGQQSVRQAARRSAFDAQAARRKERVERERWLEGLAVEVLTALGERDATIAATEQRAGAALQAMINDEHVTVAETAQWCEGTVSRRELTRLRQLASQKPHSLRR
jgi:hypothetical protein